MTNFIDFLKNYMRNPLNFFVDILDQDKHKYTYLIISILGLILGLNIITSKMFIGSELSLYTAFLMIAKTIVITIIVIYIYSWIVQLLNGFMNAESKQSNVIIVISYSLIPMIFVLFILTLLKIAIFLFSGLNSFYLINPLFYCFYLLSFVITLIYLVIGNAIAGNFTILKSILASSILPLIYTIFEAIRIFNT